MSVAVAICSAAGICYVHSHSAVSVFSVPKAEIASSFAARFSIDSIPGSLSDDAIRVVSQPISSELAADLQRARDELSQTLTSKSWRAALIDERSASSASFVPVPKPRPLEASFGISNTASAVEPENRSFLQKLSDLLPGRVMLASMEPGGGMSGDVPSPPTTAYGNLTAVYDISARVVYMPNGTKLEAHSGFGKLMDDPEHVSVKNFGATPPNIYELKPRETLFHSVHALRMNPVGTNDTLGRSGLLVHPYMLGPNGDSNGCVSVKDYETFLKAFQSGAVKRLVVVRNLSEDLIVARRLASQS